MSGPHRVFDRRALGLPDVHAELPADASALLRARDDVAGLARAAGMDRDGIDALLLAVNEACANVVRHAYAPGDPGARMVVEAWLAGDELVALVSDAGGGGALARAPGDDHGRGLPLITGLCADVHVDSPPGGGTRVWMALPLRDGA